MKKTITIISLLMAILLMPGLVKAEEINMQPNTNQTTNTAATVGDVQTPVYSVNINWEGFVFNWIYNSSTHEYGWQNEDTSVCAPIEYVPEGHLHCTQNGMDESCTIDGDYYVDNSCSTKASTEQLKTTGTYYGNEHQPHAVTITDKSTGGYVQPSVSWSSTSKYNFTTGNIFYTHFGKNCEELPEDIFNMLADDESDDSIKVYKDALCEGPAYNAHDLTYGTETYYGTYRPGYKQLNQSTLPEESRLCYAGDDQTGGCSEYTYELFLELGVDRTKTVTTPVKGDTIGYFTISLSTR